jgi:hypothetical protein
LQLIDLDEVRHFRPVLNWQPVPNPVSHPIIALKKKAGRNGVPGTDSKIGL